MKAPKQGPSIRICCSVGADPEAAHTSPHGQEFGRLPPAFPSCLFRLGFLLTEELWPDVPGLTKVWCGDYLGWYGVFPVRWEIASSLSMSLSFPYLDSNSTLIGPAQ